MTAVIDDVVDTPNLWTALGSEQPQRPTECNVADCTAARPWHVFCPEHEHLLILGRDRATDTSRWKPRWLLAHASRIALVGVFPLSARWQWATPLFVLALGVNGYLIWVLSRNYPLTRAALRRGCLAAAATWIVLRIAVDQRVKHDSVAQILRWAPFALVFAAGASLWHPVLLFLRQRLLLNRATTTLAFGVLCAMTLLAMSFTASRHVLADDSLPTIVSRWLMIAGLATLIGAAIATFIQAWWVSRSTVSTVVAPYTRRSTRRSPPQPLVLVPDSTPVLAPRPAQRSLGRQLRLELMRLSRHLATLQRATVRSLIKAASTVRKQLIVTGRYFKSSWRLFLEAVVVGMAAVMRCIAWLTFRVAVPALAAMVATAASWSFATQLTDHFYKVGFAASFWHAFIAAAYVAIAIGSMFVAWTLVSGCNRSDVLSAAWGAFRVIAPRLLLVFTVGAFVIEALSMTLGLSSIRLGPLTIIATVLVVLSFATDDERRGTGSSVEESEN